ncbi:hypothetical protein [Streptomyces abyssomicinicus]|uniref:hypothetical protein n=1 Tax=Streptomyces abyssomicinicus TaxID=574929 RepID=UPI001FE24873|nr:hypothetical protein [Streptomyces abyssomicinicus]
MFSKTNTTGISTMRALGTAVLENDHHVASLCTLAFDRGTGVSASELSGSKISASELFGTQVSGNQVSGSRSESSFAGIPVRVRDERPTKALEAGVAQAYAFGYAAAGAGALKQTTTHPQMMWALRGPEPWSDPA